MNKQDFYNSHLKRTYFFCNDDEDLKFLQKVAKYLGLSVKQYLATGSDIVYTLDSTLFSEWKDGITGNCFSVWLLKEIWESETKYPPIKIGYMVKMEDIIFVITKNKDNIVAYDPKHDFIRTIDDVFLKKITKVVDPEGSIFYSFFDNYKTVWEQFKQEDVYLSIGYNLSLHEKLAANYLSLKEYNVITKGNINDCNKLYLLAPDDFENNRTIDRQLFYDLIEFLNNHSIEDVFVLWFNDKLNIGKISEYFTLNGDYKNYATLIIRK